MIEIIDYDETIEFDTILDVLSILHHMVEMTGNANIKCKFEDANCWKENDVYFIRRVDNWKN